jgi:uncharacterized DUF497 family protein
VRFEWAENKNVANQSKHGLAFEVAARVFEDPNILLRIERTVEGEARWHATGYVLGVAVPHRRAHLSRRRHRPDHFSPPCDH